MANITIVNLTINQRIETIYPGLSVVAPMKFECKIDPDTEEVQVLSASVSNFDLYYDSTEFVLDVGSLKVDNNSQSSEHQRFLGTVREKAREVFYKHQSNQNG